MTIFWGVFEFSLAPDDLGSYIRSFDFEIQFPTFLTLSSSSIKAGILNTFLANGAESSITNNQVLGLL